MRHRKRPRTRHLLALAVACAATLATAHADPPPDLGIAPPLEAVAPLDPKARLTVALQRFEFGDYPGVIRELEVLVEPAGAGVAGGTGRAAPGVAALPRADRMEALRAYGIACAMTGRTTAAEGAFLLLLEADPSARLDAQLVRPEAVAIFDTVRARHREEVLAAYKRGRGRRYAVLNLLPPAGQLQNREYKKGYALLGVELALLALDATSGSLLYRWRGPHQDFPGHADDARALRPVNWVSFGALLAVVVYGIVDGFVVGHRRALEEHRFEQAGFQARASQPTRSSAARFADMLLLTTDDKASPGSTGIRF